MTTITTTAITGTATTIITVTMNSMIAPTLGGSNGGRSSLQPPILRGECLPKGHVLMKSQEAAATKKTR